MLKTFIFPALFLLVPPQESSALLFCLYYSFGGEAAAQLALKTAALSCQFWSLVTPKSAYLQELPTTRGEVAQASKLALGGLLEHVRGSREGRPGPSPGNFRQSCSLKLPYVTSALVT